MVFQLLHCDLVNYNVCDHERSETDCMNMNIVLILITWGDQSLYSISRFLKSITTKTSYLL